MKKVRELRWGLLSYNTCEHRDRVFNFGPDSQGKLVVRELFLGEEVEVKEVNTGVDCKCRYTRFFSCCPFGNKVLVMAGEQGAADFFCAFVRIDPGELTKESIHIEKKKVIGWEKYETVPFLVQIAENKVWASFFNSDRIWIGELKGNELVMTKHQDHLPTTDGLGAPPLPLPDGKFLAVGEWPSSTDITIITPGEHFSFRKIGDIPGEERYCVSTTLIKERFLVGFGGWKGKLVDAMWIFDLETHKVSAVKREGEWHPGGRWPALVVRDKELYVIGGFNTIAAHSLSFAALVRLIQNDRVRCAFCTCLGFPFRPVKGFKRSAFRHYSPPSL